jgi:hypothetical protein
MQPPSSSGRPQASVSALHAEHGFHAKLYEWMERAPWLAVSAAFHLFLFLVVSAIPWEALREEPRLELRSAVEVPPEVFPEDPPEPEPVVPIERPELHEPVLVDAEIPLDDPLPVDDLAPPSLSDDLEPGPFLDGSIELGLGGGGDLYGGRGPGRGRRPSGGAGSEEAVRLGLEWLARHQQEDGSWDGDGFAGRCDEGAAGGDVCGGAGSPSHDVGLTGLALLAFLGDGHTTARGLHRERVARGCAWLLGEQEESGLIGSAAQHAFLYDHAIATLALSEAYHFSRSPLLKPAVAQAVAFIHRSRNPYGAWRYDSPPTGEDDTSVTGWMVFALTSARDAGFEVDPAALEGALAFLDAVTDPVSGRVGYAERGSPSSRTPGNLAYPTDGAEALTAVGLLCRVFLGQTPGQAPVMERHAALLRAAPPRWAPEERGCDMYYWYYGTYAMFQLGGRDWAAWNRTMDAAIVRTQREDGHARGSWDPVGPWGHVGGRVYATALMTLSLEVYYRYARVLGAR